MFTHPTRFVLKQYQRCVLALAAVLVLGCCCALGQSAPPDLDAYVTKAMQTFEVPGMAVAVVKDGKVMVAKGYGVRRLGDPAPVDADTLFGIASNTKAFTTAALAMLVDEGKLKWDDAVTKYLPGFAVYDLYVNKELTVRDLVSHRSGLGLGAGDLMFWPDTDFGREDVLMRARYIRPASSFRSRYAYNNLMFIVAGQVVAAVSGKSWDDFIRERIFTPLNMTGARISSVGFRNGDNVAYPHSKGWRLEGTLTPIAMTQDRTWAAAAGIKAGVNDMAKWMIVQLNRGQMSDGKKLFSVAQSNEMWSPQISVRISEPPPALKATKPNFSAYGLGWALRDYRGRKIVSHTGGLTGMVTTVVLVPEEKLGVVVLTNQEEGGAFSAVVNHIVDYYFGVPATDWIGAYRESRTTMLNKAREAEKKQGEARAAKSQPSLELAKYAGEYEDAWYGKARIESDGGKLVLRMTHTPDMIADLKHWQYDTFKAVFRDKTIPDAFVTFALDSDGKIERMTMVPTSDLADFSFDYQDLLFRPTGHESTRSGY